MVRPLKFYGWGVENTGLDEAERERLLRFLADRLGVEPRLHTAVYTATEEALKEATGRPGIVSTRFTHVYPDGPAPYYTFNVRGTPGRLLEQWRHIKTRASDALLAAGGTITHHHAVGRDHMPWYREQRPALFGRALDAAKSVLDPARILNPGVLVP
jgi:alkyldihydroxyacetonephosphate synthase